MKVNQLFPKKQPARKLPGGLSREQVDKIEAEFAAMIKPVEAKANQFFESFTTPGGKHRWWLLPGRAENAIEDLPIEKKQFVLKYRQWFLTEINRVVLDDVKYDYDPHPAN